MMPVTEEAFAKINLSLDILRKRPDGYHDLRTVFQSVELADTLTFTLTKNSDITLTCNKIDLPVGKGNLVYKAAILLKEFTGAKEGAQIKLHKRIPVSAGLAGGSSNAAATLRGLTRLWDLPVKKEDLLALAAKLGSDVPFCLQGGTFLGEGRGEVLTRLPVCPHFYIVLANPGFHVSTAEIFKSFQLSQLQHHSDTEGLINALHIGDRQGIADRLHNVLETITISKYPRVMALKTKMQHFGPTLMCGSGPTIFTLFDDYASAKILYNELGKEGYVVYLTETKKEMWEG